MRDEKRQQQTALLDWITLNLITRITQKKDFNNKHSLSSELGN